MEAILPCFIALFASFGAWHAAVLMDAADAMRRDWRAAVARGKMAARIAVRRLGAALPVPALWATTVDGCADELLRVLGRDAEGAVADRAFARGALEASVCAGALAGAVISLSPLGIPVGAALPLGWCAARAARRGRERRQALESAMPEAFQALAISLGSGHSLAQALRFVGNHAQEPVRSEFLQASLEISCGLSATDALNGLLERLPAPGMDLVSSALVVSQRTGAPLKDLLANAASMVGERIELARRLEVKTAQARLSARLVGVMPVAMMAALTLLSSDFRAGAASPGGALAIAVAMALDVCAWLLIRRIMEVRV